MLGSPDLCLLMLGLAKLFLVNFGGGSQLILVLAELFFGLFGVSQNFFSLLWGSQRFGQHIFGVA